MTSWLWTRLQRVLRCPMCLQPAKDPTIIACQHTFCRRCIDRHVEEVQGVECPQCDRTTELRTRGKLPCNFLLNELCDGVAGAEEGLGDQHKDTYLCEKLEEVLTCPICLDQLKEPEMLGCLHTFCGQCIQTHVSACQASGEPIRCPKCMKWQLDDMHYPNVLVDTLLTILQEYLGMKSRLVPCFRHQGFFRDTFCQTCSASVCFRCVREAHSACEVVHVSDHAMRVRQSARTLSTQARYCSELLDKRSLTSERCAEHMHMEVVALDGMLKGSPRHREILKQASEVGRYWEHLKEILEQLRQKHQEMEEIHILTKSLTTMDMYDVVHHGLKVRNKIKQLTDFKVPTFNWQSNVKACLDDVGFVNDISDVDVWKCTTYGDRAVPELKSRIVLQNAETAVVGMGKVHDILCVIHMADSDMELYSLSETSKSKIVDIEESRRPLGMAVVDEEKGRLVINDGSTQLIWLTVSKDYDVTVWKISWLDYIPMRVNTSPGGHVLVAEMLRESVHIYNHAGTETGVMKLDKEYMQMMIPDRLEKGYILVGKRGDIVWLDEDLSVKHYCEIGVGPSPVVTVSCITQSFRGQIFISDYKQHRILTIEPGSRQVQHMLGKEDGIFHPSRMVAYGDMLYISVEENKQREIKIYRYSTLIPDDYETKLSLRLNKQKSSLKRKSVYSRRYKSEDAVLVAEVGARKNSHCTKRSSWNNIATTSEDVTAMVSPPVRKLSRVRRYVNEPPTLDMSWFGDDEESVENNKNNGEISINKSITSDSSSLNMPSSNSDAHCGKNQKLNSSTENKTCDKLSSPASTDGSNSNTLQEIDVDDNSSSCCNTKEKGMLKVQSASHCDRVEHGSVSDYSIVADVILNTQEYPETDKAVPTESHETLISCSMRETVPSKVDDSQPLFNQMNTESHQGESIKPKGILKRRVASSSSMMSASCTSSSKTCLAYSPANVIPKPITVNRNINSQQNRMDKACDSKLVINKGTVKSITIAWESDLV